MATDTGKESIMKRITTKRIISTFLAFTLAIGSIFGSARYSEAKTTKKEALRLYRELLSKKKIRVKEKGSSEVPNFFEPNNEITFSLVDLDKDGVPELFVNHTDSVFGLSCVAIVYYVSHGKVYAIQNWRDTFLQFKKSHILYSETFHMDVFSTSYYRLKNGKFTELARSDYDELDPAYRDYRVKNVKVNKRAFNIYTKKIKKGDKLIDPFKYLDEHLITTSNINTYLK